MTNETKSMKLTSVTAPVVYTATWTNTQKTYDPRVEGFWAVIIDGERDGIALGVDEQGYERSLRLSYGCVGTPLRSLDQAIADLVLTVARWPIAEGQLKIVKLPAVFSSRDGWFDVDYQIPEGVLSDAREAADKDRRYGDWFFRERYERKYGLRA